MTDKQVDLQESLQEAIFFLVSDPAVNDQGVSLLNQYLRNEVERREGLDPSDQLINPCLRLQTYINRLYHGVKGNVNE